MAKIYYIGSIDYLGLVIRYSYVDGVLLYRCNERNGDPVCQGFAYDMYDIKRRVRGAIRRRVDIDAKTESKTSS